MTRPPDLTDPILVMAEQSNSHVVDQTLSGGDSSLTDVPASTNDKLPAGGDAGENEYTTSTTQNNLKLNEHQSDPMVDAADAQAERTEAVKDTGRSSADNLKQPANLVVSRALELNGVTSASDAGDDTGSQGGSESDASRADSKSYGRAGSLKKQTTFKPVSFAKFSVLRTPGALATPKLSDKGCLPSNTSLVAPQQTARPRLVAKVTSNLRDSISKIGASGTKLAGAGPDPNQVWNKNRPAQPSSTKHLTDEELKQQYGIHMTSRIQEDGAGTEAKWADIDDDEDDWAPETIEWTDGTKTSLTSIEAAPAPVHGDKTDKEQRLSSPPLEQIPSLKETAKLIPSKSTTSIGPNPTILRLGASAERQARSTGVSPRSASSKLYSASASPAPPPIRSPWAAIPPVSKVTPITQSAQPQPPHRSSAGEHILSEKTTVVPPPKEISADDFNRSGRDGQHAVPRELYNSRSGRYEPVLETKKGALRNEQHFRAPSVLQRPTQNEQTGPAEPSPAFQTRRSSAQDGGHWTRRRASSTVSSGSGIFGRRMSFGRADNVLPRPTFETEKDSQPSGTSEKDTNLQESSHAVQTAAASWQRYTATGLNEGMSDASGVASASAAPVGIEEPAGFAKENPIVLQERIMKEKRMEARQRRLEQEEREEAAKRERIRQKLEALGPAPEKPKRKETLESNKPSMATPAAITPSPPKPPVPEPTGEPKQYGMMKVHHPDSVKRLVAANEKERASEKGAAMTHARLMPSPPREMKPGTAATHVHQETGKSHVLVSGKLPESKTDDKDSQWKSSLSVPGPYSPWSSNAKLSSASQSLTNPWKSLSSDRTLGNGIFEQSLGGFPQRDIPLRGHFGIDSKSTAPPSQSFPATPRLAEETSAKASLSSPEAKDALYESLDPIRHPGPIGRLGLQSSQWQQDVRATGSAAWNNFHAVTAKREAGESERPHQDANVVDTSSTLQVAFNETWRQIRAGDQAGQRLAIGVNRSVDSGAPPLSPLSGLDHPVGGLPFTDSPTRALGNVPARSSRFFPPTVEQSRRSEFDEGGGDLSPPPPEEISSHPAFTGDSSRPLVHLPGPKPVVKLPPNATVPPPPPPTFASMAAAPPRAARPLAAISWQEKINGLFGKKTIPEKRSVLAVSSVSKEPLDVSILPAVASVSFPQRTHSMSQRESGDIIAKQVEEAEEIFEDRETGSLPVVCVPNMAPPAAWLAAPRPPNLRRAKILKQIQIHSVEPYLFGLDKDLSGSVYVSVRLPGTGLLKSLALPKKVGGYHSRHRNYTSLKPRRVPKPRDGAGNFNSKQSASFRQASKTTEAIFQGDVRQTGVVS